MQIITTLRAIPIELALFGAILIGLAAFHKAALPISTGGAALIACYKIIFTGFASGSGIAGFAHHMGHEAPLLSNLFLLLTGFALLARHFEETHIPAWLPKLLPDDWTGGVALLGAIFVLSAFLDNIAAAIIGATVARTVYAGRVHIGYLAAIVAASNAGGAGSVVGDTTTTMMWIAGISPLLVAKAYLAAFVAFIVFAVPSSLMQQRWQPIQRDPPAGTHIVMSRIWIVLAVLSAAITANVLGNVFAPDLMNALPVLGLAVWLTLLAASAVHKPDWTILPETIKGTVFLLALVTAATMMPIEKLPPASGITALMLGVLSAGFDNIPLTALAIKQGGYDWGMLAFAVGFGGSMMWFGSSAGVAVCNDHPEARSVVRWLQAGWPVVAGYFSGILAYWALLGWSP
jgi:Na+/H+ antiporter NhaD/arsenite permease-like protein